MALILLGVRETLEWLDGDPNLTLPRALVGQVDRVALAAPALAEAAGHAETARGASGVRMRRRVHEVVDQCRVRDSMYAASSRPRRTVLPFDEKSLEAFCALAAIPNIRATLVERQVLSIAMVEAMPLMLIDTPEQRALMCQLDAIGFKVSVEWIEES